MNNEKYIIGAMIQWQDKALTGIDRLSAQHFTAPAGVALFIAIRDLLSQKKPLSISIIGSIYPDLATFAMDCVEHAPSGQSFEHHLQLLEDAYISRELRILLQNSLYQLDNKESGISAIQTNINNLALKVVS